MQIPKLRFSNWSYWAERDALQGLSLPGVYSIRVSASRLQGTPFQWTPEICYFGMTNSKGGLSARLRQFDRTLRATSSHGGADRFRFEFMDYASILPKLYVAVMTVEAKTKTPSPMDLRAMGAVAYLEYECLAEYLTRFGALPRFNLRSSPKYSKTSRSRRPAG